MEQKQNTNERAHKICPPGLRARFLPKNDGMVLEKHIPMNFCQKTIDVSYKVGCYCKWIVRCARMAISTFLLTLLR